MVKTHLTAFIRIQNGLGTLYKCSHNHQLCKFVKSTEKVKIQNKNYIHLPTVFYTVTIAHKLYICQEINPHLKLTVFPQIQASSPLFVFADQHFQRR